MEIQIDSYKVEDLAGIKQGIQDRYSAAYTLVAYYTSAISNPLYVYFIWRK